MQHKCSKLITVLQLRFAFLGCVFGQCSELLVTGTPSILVPSPTVAENHQSRNAEAMLAFGASITIPESELSADKLCSVVRETLVDQFKLKSMRSRATAAGA